MSISAYCARYVFDQDPAARVDIEVIPAEPHHVVIVGMPEQSARETRMRVLAALRSIGAPPPQGVVVDVQPPDSRVTADLAIACGIVATRDQEVAAALGRTLLLGDLALTGAVRNVRGVLPAILRAREWGLTSAIVPLGNEAEAAEAARVTGLDVYCARDLASVIQHLSGSAPDLLPRAQSRSFPWHAAAETDMRDVRGLHAARRALEVAAAGHHSVLMIGAPGSGKTMLARRLTGILPRLSDAESLAATATHSIAGLLDPLVGLVRERPFRAPHHTVSTAGLVGGGRPARPGELHLARGGVLFLDELMEFQRAALESLFLHLRDEDPAMAPLVVAAVNPCPCGYRGVPTRTCRCTPDALARYRTRVQYLAQHFDVVAVLQTPHHAELSTTPVPESSAVIRARVERAIAWGAAPGRVRELSKTAADLLYQCGERVGGMLRERQVRVRRVAGTSADLDAATQPHVPRVTEALVLSPYAGGSWLA